MRALNIATVLSIAAVILTAFPWKFIPLGLLLIPMAWDVLVILGLSHDIWKKDDGES